MTIKEAIKQRHMVRKYTDKPIPSNLVELLNARIAENNTTHGLNMKLVIGNSDGIGGMAKMLLTKTVHSYIVLAGKENSDLDEKLGYCGADLCLYAQTKGHTPQTMRNLANIMASHEDLIAKALDLDHYGVCKTCWNCPKYC